MQRFQFLKQSIQLMLAHLQVNQMKLGDPFWPKLLCNSLDSVNTPNLNWTTLLWMVRVFWHLYTEENGLSPCHWCSGLWINMPVLGRVLCKAIKNIAVVSCQRHADYLLLQKCLLSTLPLSSHRVVQTRKLLCSNHMLILSHFCFF